MVLGMRFDLPAVASLAGGTVAASTLSAGSVLLAIALYAVGAVFAALAAGDLAESVAAT